MAIPSSGRRSPPSDVVCHGLEAHQPTLRPGACAITPSVSYGVHGNMSRVRDMPLGMSDVGIGTGNVSPRRIAALTSIVSSVLLLVKAIERPALHRLDQRTCCTYCTTVRIRR